MLGHIFTIKALIRVALTALSIANIGVAHAAVAAVSGYPAAINGAAATYVVGIDR